MTKKLYFLTPLILSFILLTTTLYAQPDAQISACIEAKETQDEAQISACLDESLRQKRELLITKFKEIRSPTQTYLRPMPPPQNAPQQNLRPVSPQPTITKPNSTPITPPSPQKGPVHY